jgi:hypothetical protein
MQRSALVILFFVISNVLDAQIDREFWFAIPKETGQHGCLGVGGDCTAENNVSLKITAQNLDANVTISMPANGGSFTTINRFVPAGTTQVVELADSFADFEKIYANNATVNNAPIESVTNRGLFIAADNDIAVYYDYNNYWNRDLFTLKGKNALVPIFTFPSKIYGITVLMEELPIPKQIS